MSDFMETYFGVNYGNLETCRNLMRNLAETWKLQVKITIKYVVKGLLEVHALVFAFV